MLNPGWRHAAEAILPSLVATLESGPAKLPPDQAEPTDS